MNVTIFVQMLIIIQYNNNPLNEMLPLADQTLTDMESYWGYLFKDEKRGKYDVFYRGWQESQTYKIPFILIFIDISL